MYKGGADIRISSHELWFVIIVSSCYKLLQEKDFKLSFYLNPSDVIVCTLAKNANGSWFDSRFKLNVSLVYLKQEIHVNNQSKHSCLLDFSLRI